MPYTKLVNRRTKQKFSSFHTEHSEIIQPKILISKNSHCTSYLRNFPYAPYQGQNINLCSD